MVTSLRIRPFQLHIRSSLVVIDQVLEKDGRDEDMLVISAQVDSIEQQTYSTYPYCSVGTKQQCRVQMTYNFEQEKRESWELSTAFSALIGLRTIAIIGEKLIAYGSSLGPLLVFDIFEAIHLE